MRQLAHSTQLASLTLLLALAAVPLTAGTLITIEQRELPDGTAETTTLSIERNLVAIGGGAGDGRMIFRGDRQEMLLVDDEKESYVVLDEAMVKGIAGQMDAMMKQMDEALKSLPKEQQEAARRMMQQQAPRSGGAPPAVTEEVKRTGERATREGYPCVKYEVFEGAAKIRELWVTAWSNVEGEEALGTAMSSLGDFTSKMMSSMGSLAGGDESPASASIASWWRGIEGMPIVTTEIEDGVAVEESVVRSIETTRFDAEQVFEVPEHYDRQSFGDQ